MTQHPPLVRDVMTPQPHVVHAGTPIAEAQELMSCHGIRHLPVVNDGGEPIGMLSEQDVNLACGLTGQAEPSTLVALDVCHGRPLLVDPLTPLRDVAQRMADNQYGSVIVVQDGKVAGIFTTVDACRALAALLAQPQEAAANLWR